MKLSQKLTQRIIALIIISIIFSILYQFSHALLPFILAIFLTYILSPVVSWLSKKKIGKFHFSRGFSIILIYIIFISSFSVGGTYFMVNLASEMQTLAKDIPSFTKEVTEVWIPKIGSKIEKATEWLPQLNQETKEKQKRINIKKLDRVQKTKIETSKIEPSQNEIIQFLNNTRFEIRSENDGYTVIPQKKTWKEKSKTKDNLQITGILNDMVGSFMANLQNIFLDVLSLGQKFVVAILGSLFSTFIVLMITGFMIADEKKIINFFISLIPSKYRKGTDDFLGKLDTGLSGVVRGQLIICLVNGILTGIGLIIFDIKFALTLSILATVCSLIPIFGVIISSIPIVLVAITQSFFAAILMVGWVLGIHFIEGNFLNPKIIGKSAEIHPVLVIFALVLGERTYGLVGALLAVPLFSILQTTFLFTLESTFEYKRDSKKKIEKN